MSIINISNLTFSYPGASEKLFEDVSLALDSKWKLGLIGRNGRGKTTFLNLLRGALEYNGKITSSVSFEYFPYEINGADRITKDIAAEIIPEYEEWRLFAELSLLDVDEKVLERRFYTLSNGERMKVMLASMFLRENAFLLIDEPTNHLDMHGREKVGGYLRGKSGFILVSHDRRFLDSCIDHVLSINRSGIELQKGNYSSWQRNKDYKDHYELAQNNKLRSQIAKLDIASKRVSGWSDKLEKTKYGTGLKPDRGYIGAKSAKMMRSAKSLEKRLSGALSQKESLLKDVETPERLKMNPLTYHSEYLIRAKNLGVAYEDTVFENISFELKRNQRIAIIGKNGSGKSSILKLAAGLDVPHGGEFIRASGLKVCYVPQDTSFLGGSIFAYARENGIDETVLLTNLSKLGFSKEDFTVPMQDLSGGQKKKILIAASLSLQAHLYIWDEPLNYIDIISRIQIENLILENSLSMLFVEHDADFVEAVSTDLIYL